MLALSPGKVKQLPDFKKIEKVYQVEILHFLTVGSEIREYKNNLDGWGYVISVSDDFKKGMENAEKAVKLIDKGITRK